MAIPAMLLPILHPGSPDPTGWLHSDWNFVPTVVIGSFALAAVYLWLTGSRNRRRDGSQINPVTGKQRASFLLGCLLLLISLNPPLDDWAGHFLISAHMLQHLLLIFGVAPLLLLGTPDWLCEKLLGPKLLERTMYYLTRPLIAFAISNVIMIFWHLPFAYDAALRNEMVHIIEHNMLLFGGILLWWPVIGPMPSWPQLAPPLKCLYLFAQSIPGQAVGAFVTLAAPGLYASYDSATRIWGISLANDQQMAGLMMWVLTGVIYLAWITVIFFSWASQEEASERGEPGKTADSAKPKIAPGVR